jgi:hypothetical protein
MPKLRKLNLRIPAVTKRLVSYQHTVSIKKRGRFHMHSAMFHKKISSSVTSGTNHPQTATSPPGHPDL